MKKLLSILGATSLIATTSVTVVACSPKDDNLANLTLTEGITTKKNSWSFKEGRNYDIW